MPESIYRTLAAVLDTLPNGFPPTENGVELKLLKKIFTPEEAELFCDLRLSLETPEQIALRTGRRLDGLEDMLTAMWRDKGQLFGIELENIKLFKMMPWAIGIYEFQINRMDREFAELCEEYNATFAREFFAHRPAITQVIPVEEEIPDTQEVLSYEKVSVILEQGQAFAVADCICRKERRIMGEGCDKPLEACLAISPVPDVFDNYHWGRPISKEEACELLRKTEEAGLVHQISNVEEGHFFICNCCGCCCGILRSMNEFGITNAVTSNYYAEIDPALCSCCGICAEERCQVHAIEEEEDAFVVMKERCIGCGLCVSTCPSDAVTLRRKTENEQIVPPKDERAWLRERARNRSVDFSRFE